MSLFSQLKDKIFPNQFPLVGVDISEASIELLQLQSGAEKPVIKCSARLELKPGLMSKGKIEDLDYVADILSLAYSQAKPAFSSKYCLLSLPDRYTYFLTLQIAALATVPEILEQAQSKLPIDLKQCYSDYQIVEQLDDKAQVFFVAAEKDLVSQYLQIFNKTNLHLAVIDFESACLVRALGTDLAAPVFIVDIGAESTDIVLHDKNGFRDQTNLCFGGRNLTAVISENLKIDLVEAENLKRVQGFDLKNNLDTILKQNTHQIIEEINKMRKNYEVLSGQQVKAVILAGGSSLLPGLKDFFAASLPGLQIEIGQVDKKMDLVGKELRGDKIFYSNVLGLALRGLNKENLNKGINLIK
jgi:type IV pilus assembly protein PilM